MSDVAQKLATNFRVHSVDLPGYGYSKLEESDKRSNSKPQLLDNVVDELFLVSLSRLRCAAGRWVGNLLYTGQHVNLKK